jgi:hypothetical protein
VEPAIRAGWVQVNLEFGFMRQGQPEHFVRTQVWQLEHEPLVVQIAANQRTNTPAMLFFAHYTVLQDREQLRTVYELKLRARLAASGGAPAGGASNAGGEKSD